MEITRVVIFKKMKEIKVMMYWLNKIWNLEIFQGKYKKKNYFEGWYYKIIDGKTENALAVIPGISLGQGKEDRHAFIQVLDARHGSVRYLRFNIAEFEYNQDRFQFRIADNFFSDREIHLNILEQDWSMTGHLTFDGIVKFPRTFLRPGIMGPYTFVPFMECYHDIVNIHHNIAGQLDISGQRIDFDGGYGYIEKDRGRSFPEAWIWLQSNHFETGDVSLMFSIARIPWLRGYFSGFISFIRISDKIHLFSTYTRAKVTKLNDQDNHLQVAMEDRHLKMIIDVEYSSGGVLKAPKNGLMEREILESISAVARVKLVDRKGAILFEGEGTHTGLEVVSEMFDYYNRYS